MTHLQFEQFNNTQLRIIKSYCQHHPELNRNEAAYFWIKKYAATFRTWWNKHEF